MAAFAVFGHAHPFVATGRQGGQQHHRKQGQQDISSGMSHNCNNAGYAHLLCHSVALLPNNFSPLIQGFPTRPSGVALAVPSLFVTS